MDDAQVKQKRPFRGPIPQRFSAKYERYRQLGGQVEIVDDALAYAGDGPLWDTERLMFFSLTFDQICKEKLAGDFAELGVYKGGTAALLARYARRLGRHVYLLDTYEGFDKRDFTGPDSGRASRFADTSLDAVRARVGDDAATFIKGYFPQTASQLPDDARYCLVHIDTDLYAPIWSGLEYFYPRMVPGGFMIVHDYGSLAWAGADKAVDAFFADKPECLVHIPDSCGSAVIRKMRPPGAGPTWIQQQQRLQPQLWHAAKFGALNPVLKNGWSTSEAWGTWGVGASHTLELFLDPAEPGQAIIDLDMRAFVWPDEPVRQVEVLLNGAVDHIANMGERAVISLALPASQRSAPALTLTFRPLRRAIPRDVIASSEDTRELGIALHRLRIRYLEN
jgi:hypothetical protein